MAQLPLQNLQIFGNGELAMVSRQDVPGRKLGQMLRINGLFHLLIMRYIGLITHLETFDPNFRPGTSKYPVPHLHSHQGSLVINGTLAVNPKNTIAAVPRTFLFEDVWGGWSTEKTNPHP